MQLVCRERRTEQGRMVLLKVSWQKKREILQLLLVMLGHCGQCCKSTSTVLWQYWIFIWLLHQCEEVTWFVRYLSDIIFTISWKIFHLIYNHSISCSEMNNSTVCVQKPTQRHCENNMISSDPLAVVTLDRHSVHSVLCVVPVDAAHRPIVGH